MTGALAASAESAKAERFDQPAFAGLVVGADAYGPTLLADPATTGTPTPLAAPPLIGRANPRVCVLAEYGLLTATGADARTFLNGQLTNDILNLAADCAQLDGYCTPKGRLLASFIEWPTTDGLSMTIARELAAPIAKRLSMYVMRSKLKIKDESNQWVALGLQDPGSHPSAPPGQGQADALARLGLAPPAVWQVTRAGAYTAIGLPQAGGGQTVRTLLWLPVVELPKVLELIGQPLSDSQAWRLADITAGLPRIVPASSELFVPQMLNFDLINAVNFKKGCYPGQEVVARSHYLGKLKRRMYRGSTSVLPAPGDDVLQTAESSAADSAPPNAAAAPVGKVVMAAAITDQPGRFALLIELQVAAARAGGLIIAGGGAAISLEPLPYEIPA